MIQCLLLFAALIRTWYLSVISSNISDNSSHDWIIFYSGNRFLADLCDADVLVHVVDATGQSDKDGNVLGKGETGAHLIVWFQFVA